jgi:hypothetical protein
MRYTAIVVALLAVVAVPSRGFAALDCLTGGSQSVATCSVAADCVAVGGIDCTQGFCYCPSAETSPFCPCALQPAPVASASTLVLLVGLLTAVAVFQIRRQAARNRR